MNPAGNSERDRTVALPRPLTSFIGRTGDLAAGMAFLANPHLRLLTLVGPGGVGKTRLAIELAARASTTFVDVAFVSVAHVRDPRLVPDSVLAALGVAPIPGRLTVEIAAEAIGDRRTLLVLDNVEGVVDSAPWLAELLARCPALTVLATGRASLGISGEQLYPVKPFDVSGEQGSDAVALFTERARAVVPGFALDETTTPIVEEICARLDRLPLAIELAAARVGVMPLKALRDRLDARLALLVGGPSDAPARHQTLRDAIAWSYDLLTPREQAVFRRLSVFEGGISLDAIGSVCASGPSETIDAVGAVTALARQSLLQPASSSDDVRFVMLETIREYGLRELERAGEAETTRSAHADACLALAEAVEPELSGADRVRLLTRLHADRDNIRAALEYSIAAGDGERALRLAAALWRFWVSDGALREGRDWLARSLATDGGASRAVRAKALHYLGNLALDLGDHEGARQPFEESLALRRSLGDRRGTAASLTGLGLALAERGDHDAARDLHEQSLTLQRELGDRRGEAIALHNLGRVTADAGDLAAARRHHAAALAIQRDLDDRIAVAYSQWRIGEIARRQDRAEEARTLLDAALDAFRDAEDRIGCAYALHALAGVALQEADVARAIDLDLKALSIRQELGERIGMIECLESLAGLVAENAPERALQWWSVTSAARDALHAPVPPVDREPLDRAIARAQASVDERARAVAWAARWSLTLAAAAAEAAEVAAAQQPMAGDIGLTPRERDVLRLLVQGLSDREIANALFMSPRTVSWHVGHILTKLEVDSRTAAATRAVRLGIA